MDAFEAHVEPHFGPAETVFHEIISETVHLDIFDPKRKSAMKKKRGFFGF